MKKQNIKLSVEEIHSCDVRYNWMGEEIKNEPHVSYAVVATYKIFPWFPIKSKFYLQFDEIRYSITKPKVLWENSPESDNTVLVTFIPHGVEGAKYDATRFAYLDEAKAMIEKMKNNPNQFLLP